jgi:hypothetical protein
MIINFTKNLALFLYLCLIVSFVWVALNQSSFRQVLREGLKTFGIFTACSLLLSLVIYILS